MTPRRGRQRPARRPPALALALGWLIALGPWIGGPARPAAAQAARPPQARTIYHKSRSFRIPFNVDAADQPRLKEVQLWVSEDSGFTWKVVSRSTPDRPSFTFRAGRDAEYWFAVRTLDNRGELYPAKDETVEPSLKVIVDTTPPSLVLESDGRRGSVAAVRWEVRDENLDLRSFVVEYQVEGGRDWRQLPVRGPALIGSERWDAGTAEPLKVRGSVSDKAGNTTEVAIRLPEGTSIAPPFGGDTAEYSAPPPVSPISNRARPDSRGEVPFVGGAGIDPFAAEPATAGQPPSRGGNPSAAAAFEGGFDGGDPFAGTSAAASAPVAPDAPAPPTQAGPGSGAGQTLLVPSPRFPLQYVVDDAGPNGPASVELWVTHDGGRTWYRRGEDPDRTSPFPVDLGGEGTFGLRLVARAATGLGDQPPAPGDPPFLWVEVDSTPPMLKLWPPVVGRGPEHLGKLAIVWQASDVHLGNSPVTLYWRPVDSPEGWQPITKEPLENVGKYIWNVPESVPPRFHVRIDVVDTAGNRSTAETSQGPPVLVDRTRPRSRIIGLDPSALGGNPANRPIR